MNKQIEILRNTRKHLLGFINDLSTEELNAIPQGFNNNIIWNLAHLTATQQNACYLRAGLDLQVDEKYFHLYKPDTKPTAYIDDAEVGTIKQMLLTLIDKLETDYNNNAFVNYKPWTNRYGFEVANIDDMLGFLPFHEGLHLGYTMALKRALRHQKSQ
jgi:hypothetical protein